MRVTWHDYKPKEPEATTLADGVDGLTQEIPLKWGQVLLASLQVGCHEEDSSTLEKAVEARHEPDYSGRPTTKANYAFVAATKPAAG